MKKIIKTSLMGIAGLTLLINFSCLKDEQYSGINVDCIQPELTITNTISQVKEMYTFGGATLIENELNIAGYVVSNDKEGNFYKSITIQDNLENPTSGIKIALERANNYASYEIGRKVFIKLKGLAVGYSYGSIQLGKLNEGNLTRIPEFEIDNHIIRTCDLGEVVPKKFNVDQIDKRQTDILIEIDEAQFNALDLGKTYANLDDNITVERHLEVMDNSCGLNGVIALRTSGFANFKKEILPEGKGKLVGILDRYYEDFFISVSSSDDIQFLNDRCDYSNAWETTITIQEIRDKYNQDLVEFGFDESLVVTAYVNSTDAHGNFKNRLTLQDNWENPTAGIQMLIGLDEINRYFKPGDLVLLKINALYMDRVDGVLTIGVPGKGGISEIPENLIGQVILNTGTQENLIPTNINIDQSSSSYLESTLVKLNNVQLVQEDLGKAFAYYSGNLDGYRVLESCNIPAKISVFTSGEADFAGDRFPEGRGEITGILTKNLELRSINDINFNKEYELCPVVIPKLIISEIADPVNSTGSRFVELYNTGATKIDLNGWKLNKYVNGSTSVSGEGLDLTGISIEGNEFVVIANTSYKSVFNDIPEKESTYISGNGDDVYALIDNTNSIIDVYGLIGEDGNGTNWEYLDGRARRNLEITQPNAIFDPTEWTIYTGENNTKVDVYSVDQKAPENFNPRER